MHAYFLRIVRRRRTVIALTAVITMAAAALASTVRGDYSVEQFFPTWGEERAIFDEYRRIFPREDAQVAFFMETPGGMDLEGFRVLSRVAGFMEEAGVQEVTWAGSLPWVADAAAESAAELARALAGAQGHPLSGWAWNEDGSVHVVQGVLPPEMNNDADRRSVESALTPRIEAMRLHRRWALSGTPVLRARVPELLEVDQTLFLGGGILLFFAFLFVFFRRVGQALTSLGAVVPAYLVTLAVMALTGTRITLLTSFIPIVILVVGICDTTHILVRWRTLLSEGASREGAVVRAFTELVRSCFFTSLTTAIGFASLMATGIGIVADFGFYSALAILLTFGFSVTLLPALLASGGDVPGDSRSPAPVGLGGLGMVRRARRAAIRRSWWVLPLFGFAALSGIVLGSGVSIDTYLVDDLKEESAIIQDLRWIENAGFGLFQANLFLRGAPEKLASAEMMDWTRRFQERVRRESLVTGTLALPDVGGGDAPGEGLSAWLYRPASEAAQVVVAVRDAGSRETLPFLERMDEWVEANPPPHGTAHITGTVRMAHTFSFHVLRSFGPSILLALALIWLVMAFLFRSAKLGVLAMVPNVFPLLVLVGVMALAGVALKPSTILVFSIAFGIAVDDSIHLMGRFQHLLQGRGWTPQRALRGAIRDTGPALVLSTLVVSGGFLLLLASQFQVLFLVGLLTALTAFTALVADLFLLPALLQWSFRSGWVSHCRTG
jgi:predicted RND superfamily exporter protein